MNNRQSPSSFKSMDSLEEWMNHPFMEWLSKNKQQILWGFLLIFAALIFTYRFISARTLSAERDFFEVQSDFTALQKEGSDLEEKATQETLHKLVAILSRHPELHAKYDGSIAQVLLLEHEIPQAKEWAERNFKRIQFVHMPLYQSYAMTSLLIGAGDYAQAAIEAEQLKEKMGEEQRKDFGGVLYLFNLIRLATLYQQLNQPENEWRTWEAVQQASVSAEALAAVQELFQEGSFSLNQYIAERKQVVNL